MIWDGDILVLDLIPVRKGNVGYMYDRVSGQLFGNQGTGEFVLGKDVGGDVEYTAKDYVQDGLVAMWDGVENAGWGVHDPSATVWKDLSGNGNDLTQTGTVNTTWENDACVFDKKRSMGMSSFPVAKDAVLSKNWTLEVVFSITSTDNINGSLFGLGYSGSRVLWVYANATTTIISALYQNTIGIPVGKNTLNQTNHIAITGDGRVYVNGEFYSQRISSTNEPDSTILNIGCLPLFKDYMIGKINAIRFGGENLTAEEIAYNYNIDKARFGL